MQRPVRVSHLYPRQRTCLTFACRGRAEQRHLALRAVYRRASDAVRWTPVRASEEQPGVGADPDLLRYTDVAARNGRDRTGQGPRSALLGRCFITRRYGGAVVHQSGMFPTRSGYGS